jgi:release factor glutamine methyltransferase
MSAYFRSHEIDSPRATAEILLAHALHMQRIELYIRYDQPLHAGELQQLKTLIGRRSRREPVAYITGRKEFWSLDLEVTPDALIPRPETECLVEAAVEYLDAAPIQLRCNILELGTGSGAIGVALASRYPQHLLIASDSSIKAIRVAWRNAQRLGLSGRICFICSSWLNAFANNSSGFDLIVSNPPYIKTGVLPDLQPEIFAYEPLEALDGDHDGLGSIRHIVESAHAYLKPGGCLLLEIGYDQKEPLRQIAVQGPPYADFRCRKDYSGRDRVVSLIKK